MSVSIKAARVNADLTQEEMAKRLNISKDTYRKIEKTPEIATITQAKAIAEIVSIPIDDLFFAANST